MKRATIYHGNENRQGVTKRVTHISATLQADGRVQIRLCEKTKRDGVMPVCIISDVDVLPYLEDLEQRQQQRHQTQQVQWKE